MFHHAKNDTVLSSLVKRQFSSFLLNNIILIVPLAHIFYLHFLYFNHYIYYTHTHTPLCKLPGSIHSAEHKFLATWTYY